VRRALGHVWRGLSDLEAIFSSFKGLRNEKKRRAKSSTMRRRSGRRPGYRFGAHCCG